MNHDSIDPGLITQAILHGYASYPCPSCGKLAIVLSNQLEKCDACKWSTTTSAPVGASSKGANSYMHGGNHYRETPGEQHWDRVWRLYGRGYFVGCATKYLERYHMKNGVEDLQKAIHYIQKLIELEEAANERSSVSRTRAPEVKE